MTTVLRVTFADDAEADRFAAMLGEGECGVVYRDRDDNLYEECWPEPKSITSVEAERQC